VKAVWEEEVKQRGSPLPCKHESTLRGVTVVNNYRTKSYFCATFVLSSYVVWKEWIIVTWQ